jgi:mannose-6-phosphate isomerase-like protein (cupin superfamily)
MKMIEFFHSKDMPFRTVSTFAPKSMLDAMTDSDKNTEVKTHFPGNEAKPSLIEIKETPNGQATLHSHAKEEIFCVLEGEMHFGHRVCKAGDSINIAANTQYTFKTGPEGCRYLKFTASVDHSFIIAAR